MTPTQPEPFTGGSQDAHQKRGMDRAHGCLSSGQASPMVAPVLPEVAAHGRTDLQRKTQWVLWEKGRGPGNL